VRLRWSRSAFGFSPNGWSGVADDTPTWTATVVARWTAPWIDWGWVAAGSVVAIVCALAAIATWRDGRVLVAAFSALFSLWTLWKVVRTVAPIRARSVWELTLSPGRLTLTDSKPASRPVIVDRETAGWLVAADGGADWHARWLGLYHERGADVAPFLAAMARIEVRAAGVPSERELPTEIPVSVLLGAWWPHPARRMTRWGTAGIQRPWREPDIAGFPRRERLERAKWSLLYLAFAALSMWVALDSETRDGARILFGIAAVALAIWRIRAIMWRPTFLS
jgi:hypothetical protein